MKRRSKLILMIEDNPGDARLIQEMLREVNQGWIKLEHCSRLSQAVSLLKNNKYDVVLLDLGLPDSKGIETLVGLREFETRVPVVVLTGIDDEELGLDALNLGAQDYISKMQVDGQILNRTIQYAIERKKIEDKLRESEDRFRATFDKAAVGIGHFSKEGKWLRVNKKLCDILSATEDELLEDSNYFASILNTEVIENDGLSELWNNEVPEIKFEKYYIDIKKTKWLKIVLSTVKTSYDDIPYGVAIVEDITQRKLSDQAILESENKFSTIFKETQSLVLITELKTGKIFDVNQVFLNVFGLSKSEIIGTDFRDLSIISKEEIKHLKNEFIKNFSLRNIQVKAEKASGEIGYFVTSATLITINTQKYVLSTSHDITDRVVAEEKIKNYNLQLEQNKKELEKKSNELTILSENLKELNASKDKFFSILAHDLRSPFTALLGISDFLNQHIDELSHDEIKEFSSHLNRSLNGIFKLVENLLQWSRVQSGRIEFEPEIFDINALIDDILELYKQNFNNKDIKLNKNYEGELNVFADKNMINTVIRNLISNAVKFTNIKGEISVISKLSNGNVLVKVKDNGVGIDKNDIPNLFKIDETVTSEGTENEKGTGLGLILCKEFVEKNKGKINVSSEIGKGTEFSFTLPLSKN